MRYPTVHPRIGLSVCVAIGLVLTAVFADPGGLAEAREGNRTLKLYFGHTKERGEFTFKRNGRYDKAGLARINRFLRDWRRNEPAKMDPKLLDLVWAIYQDVGARDYIHVVSAYRSLRTNNMLRSRSSGVAEKSQHTAGRAMDFYIPGVPLAKLRATAMRFQGGGVGYYPSSGSPFVHVDTGNVRSWPRMTRQQLIALFPNGETLYLPADGKPLPGYQRALARRKAGGDTALAYLQPGADADGRAGGNKVAGWLKRVFNGGADEAEDNEMATAPAPTAPGPAAPAPSSAPASVPTAPVQQPAAGDPQILIAAAEEALDARIPKARPQTGSEMMLASISPDLPPETVTTPDAIGTIASVDVAPLPRSRPDSALLAESIEAAQGTTSLAVGTEDAIAALAARSEEFLLARASTQVAAPVRSTEAKQDNGVVPPAPDGGTLTGYAAADRSGAPARTGDALAAANSLARERDGARSPQPRPVELAFAGAGLRASERPAAAAPRTPVSDASAPTEAAPAAPRVAVSAPPTVADFDAPAAAKGDLIQLAAPPAAAVTEPVSSEEAEKLARIIEERAEAAEFSILALPQPASAPGLFTVPESAAAVAAQAANPKLPTLRFQAAEPAAPKSEESFFSRLFANLAE